MLGGRLLRHLILIVLESSAILFRRHCHIIHVPPNTFSQVVSLCNVYLWEHGILREWKCLRVCSTTNYKTDAL